MVVGDAGVLRELQSYVKTFILNTQLKKYS